MITANRLNDGIVVFLDAQGAWSEDFHQGAIVSSETDKAAALKRAAEAEALNEIVGPYYIELETRGGRPVPKALREAIRATGPTVRRDLGKQAQGYAPGAPHRAAAEG